MRKTSLTKHDATIVTPLAEERTFIAQPDESNELAQNERWIVPETLVCQLKATAGDCHRAR